MELVKCLAEIWNWLIANVIAVFALGLGIYNTWVEWKGNKTRILVDYRPGVMGIAGSELVTTALTFSARNFGNKPVTMASFRIRLPNNTMPFIPRVLRQFPHRIEPGECQDITIGNY